MFLCPLDLSHFLSYIRNSTAQVIIVLTMEILHLEDQEAASQNAWSQGAHSRKPYCFKFIVVTISKVGFVPVVLLCSFVLQSTICRLGLTLHLDKGICVYAKQMF